MRTSIIPSPHKPTGITPQANGDLRVRLKLSGTFGLTQSGRGQPHSKTLARLPARHSVREVLECGCPLPLFILKLPEPPNALNRSCRPRAFTPFRAPLTS